VSIDALVLWAENEVQASALGVALSESAYAFPVIEGLHLLGLSVSVGLLFMADLRLMGFFMRHVPAREVLRELRPWVLGGFALVFATGVLLFWAEAPTLMASPAFPFKLLFIGLAGLNALYFERVVARRPGALDGTGAVPPPAVRRAGLASLLLWSAVIVAGRLIPYLPSWP
jgi:hypothetical protein